MMNESENVLNIARYLARIGYDGPKDTPCTLETLRRLQWCHACTIPFENLDVLLDGKIQIDGPGVYQKLVVEGRGGYCFEHNTLFLEMLTALGFEVHGLSGRVGSNRQVVPPRTHYFGQLILDGVPWLVDVGVGGFTPTCPLRMDTEDAQETPHDTRRLVQDKEANLGNNRSKIPLWYHQVLIDDQWRDVYRFTGELMPEIDREVANWWTSTHPESKFCQSIMAAIASADGSRHTLDHDQYAHRLKGKVIEKEQISSKQRLLEILDERFGIVLSKDTRFGIGGF